MCEVSGWHASPRGAVATMSTADTGEVRVPISLYHVDEHQGDAPLVLSRAEAEVLHLALAALLDASAPRYRNHA